MRFYPFALAQADKTKWSRCQHTRDTRATSNFPMNFSWWCSFLFLQKKWIFVPDAIIPCAADSNLLFPQRKINKKKKNKTHTIKERSIDLLIPTAILRFALISITETPRPRAAEGFPDRDESILRCTWRHSKRRISGLSEPAYIWNTWCGGRHGAERAGIP